MEEIIYKRLKKIEIETSKIRLEIRILKNGHIKIKTHKNENSEQAGDCLLIMK